MFTAGLLGLAITGLGVYQSYRSSRQQNKIMKIQEKRARFIEQEQRKDAEKAQGSLRIFIIRHFVSLIFIMQCSQLIRR